MQLIDDAKHTINFENQGECTNIWLDEKLLRHILTNLLSNAIKYSPVGSTGMDLGADIYLTKPFRRTDLLKAIAVCLEKQAAIRQALKLKSNDITQPIGE